MFDLLDYENVLFSFQGLFISEQLFFKNWIIDIF